ncbi:MAG: hypothetical protein U1F34_05610 [Gammaproteobacteria bacterium]
MKPTRPTTVQERQVLRWVLAIIGIIVGVSIAMSWWKQSKGCRTECVQNGFDEGSLQFTGGSKFSMKTYCECTGSADTK